MHRRRGSWRGSILDVLVIDDEVRLSGARRILGCLRDGGGGVDVEPPHAGTIWFTETLEDDSTMTVEDFDCCFIEENGAIGVTEFSNADEVVSEIIHDVTIFSARWQVREKELGKTIGCYSKAVVDRDFCWRGVVIAGCDRGSAVEVVIACSSVGDGGEV